MNEEVQLYIDDAKEKMEKTIKHLNSELLKIRAGKANPHILDGVKVDYYGTKAPLTQIANINTPDTRTIIIQPWEKTMIEPIEKAIMQANLGFNPANNGELIRIIIPALTEERRKELVKVIKSEGENAKVGIRSARRDANENFKKMQKDGLSEDIAKDAETETQKLTDTYSKKVDEIVEAKEKEVMTV